MDSFNESQIEVFMELVKDYKIRLIKSSDLEPNKFDNTVTNLKCGTATITQKILDGNQIVNLKEFIYAKIDWLKLANEIVLLASLNHNNIPKFYGIVIEDATFGEKIVSLVSEYIEGQTLNEYKANKYEDFKEEEKITLIKDLCEIISYLHSKKFVHRDIKPENLKIDKNKKIYLTDFGTAKVIDEEESKSTRTVGSMNFIPPEAVEGVYEENEDGKHELINFVTTKYDIWAFGCLVSNLFTGDDPWFTQSEVLILKKLKDKEPFTFKKSKINNENIIKIIHMCTEVDVSKRCEINEVKSILDKM